MREAVIVSTARTPIGKAVRGAFNNTHGATMAGHVIQKAVERAKVAPGEVEDVILGCANPEGATGHNIARDAAIRAGLPVTVPGETINRFCSSGLMAISIAAQRIMVDGIAVAVGGGLESISLVQYNMNKHRFADEWLVEHKPEVYMSMIETADTVAQRYQVTREAQKAGRFDTEIAPMKSLKLMTDKDSGKTWTEEVTLAKDEGNRPDTSRDGLASLKPVRDGGYVTAGNASQLSDGASACVVMDAKMAEKRGLEPLGIYRGMAVAGCEPDEMGIGPVFAVPKLLKQHGLKVEDIDLWELNEPRHRSQQVQCRWRCDLDRPPLWHERRPPDRACADRRQAPRRQARRGHHVHRRRHGRGGPLRDRLSGSIRKKKEGRRKRRPFSFRL